MKRLKDKTTDGEFQNDVLWRYVLGVQGTERYGMGYSRIWDKTDIEGLKTSCFSETYCNDGFENEKDFHS